MAALEKELSRIRKREKPGPKGNFAEVGMVSHDGAQCHDSHLKAAADGSVAGSHAAAGLED